MNKEKKDSEKTENGEKETPGYYGRLSLLFVILAIYGFWDATIVKQVDDKVSVFIGIAVLFIVALLLFFRYGSIKRTTKRTTKRRVFNLEPIELDKVDIYEDLELTNDQKGYKSFCESEALFI